MLKKCWRTVLVGMLCSVGVAPGAAQERFKVLATNRTSTMEVELNEAGSDGYRFVGTQGGETFFGGSETVVLMMRDPEGKRFRYILLATSRTSTMESELNDVPTEFNYVGMTVFKTRFGGEETVVVLEAETTTLASASAPPAASRSPSDATSSSASSPTAERELGIYMVREDGPREMLTPNSIARVEEEGGGLFGRPQRFGILNGVSAAARSRNHFQVFEFTFPAGAAITGRPFNPDRFVLVQLYEDREYDERTLDILPGGPDLDVVIPFSTEQVDSGTFRVQPSEPLGLGEFGFFVLDTGVDMQRGVTVWDFGIDP